MGPYDAVIFDMDGTLIEQEIDFVSIRAELAVPANMGILEAIALAPPETQPSAMRKLVDAEVAAAGRAALMAGAHQTLSTIQAAGLKTALLTRNGPEAVDVVLGRFNLTFDLVWTRDQGPIKPEPDGVLRACRELGVQPGRTVCIGDFRYDVEAANAAGAVSVLLAHGLSDDDADEADYVITELTALLGILEI